MTRNRLAILLLAALTLLPLQAQFSTFACVNGISNTPVLHAGGHAELVGEIVWECTGSGSGNVTSDFTVFLSANYTGRIIDTISNKTESLLIVDDPASPALGPNVFQGLLVAPNAILFRSVQFSTPGTRTMRIRIVNIRVDAGGLYIRNSSEPNRILAFTSALNVPFNQPQQVVGIVGAGPRLRITDATGVPQSSLRFNGAASATYKIQFDELSPAAFRKRNVATSVAAPTALAPQAEYGRDYSTESGFYLPALNANDAGLAGHGTRLMASFTNIPNGVTLAVSVLPVSGGAVARLIATNPDGSGAFSAVTAGSDGTAPLPVSGGSATAVWEVLSADPAVIESIQFNLVATSSSGANGSVGFQGQLAPANPKSAADATAPIPRFTVPTVVDTGCGANCLLVPSAISVSYTLGAPAPAPIAIPVSSSGGSLTFQATATNGLTDTFGYAPPDGNWISLSAASGVTPAALSAAINPAGLMPGKYAGLITVTSGRFSERVIVVLHVRQDAAGTVVPYCSSGSGVPPIVRPTGLTELQGDIVANCVSGSTGVTTDVRVTLNTSITSRPNDLLLLIDEPSPFQQTLGTNVFRGERTSDTQVVFRNVVLPPAASVLRVTNIFADVSRLAVSTTAIPTQTRAKFRLSALSQTEASDSIGFVQPTHSFALLNGSTVTGGSLIEAPNGRLRFREESFAPAFKRRNAGTSFASPNNLVDQPVPGAIYNTETGFYNTALPNNGGLDMGLATQGTRLIARFNNVPPGMNISVSGNELGAVTPRTQRIQTDSNGAGAFVPITGAYAPVTITNGTGVAVWEVLNANQLSADTFEFGLQVTGIQAPSATVEGFLGPLSTVNTADATAPIPRFTTANGSNQVCPSFPCLRASTVSLTSNGTAIASAPVSVTSDADPVPFTVADPTVPWLTIQLAAGVTPGQFTLLANPAGLPAGTHTTTLAINGLTIPVSFTVQSAGPAALLLPVERLRFSFNAGVAPAPQTLPVNGTTGLAWTATPSAPWLQVSAANGTAPATPTISINAALLPAGEYDGFITFTAAGAAPVAALVHASVAPNTGAYAITGAITGPASAPRPNVTVTLSGAESRTAITAADGSYSFSGLTASGPYTVTPSAAGVTFTPPALSFTTIPTTQIANFTASLPGVPPTVSLGTPIPTTGTQRTFVVNATDADGVANLSRVYFQIHDSPTTPANTCHGFYDRAQNAFFLYDDALATLQGPVAPGAANALGNTQCQLIGAASTATTSSATTLTLNLTLSLKTPFASAARNLYLFAQDADGNGSGWQQMAAWLPTLLRPPTLSAATRPASPALAEGVQFTVSDPDGPTDLARAYFLINDTTNIPATTCHGFYDFTLQAFYLYDDSLTKLLGPLAPGARAILDNSQCAIDGLTSTANANGQITLSLTRLGNARKRAQKVFLWATDRTNLGTGWVDTGLAYAAGANVAPTVTSPVMGVLGASQRIVGAWLDDLDNPADINRVYFLINPTPTISANSCHGFYDRPTRAIYLYNDALTTLSGPITFGSTNVIENSQCRLQDLRDNAFFLTTRGFPFDFTVTRKGPAASAATNVYFWSVDLAGNGTGWTPIGAWTVNNTPTVSLVPPPTLYGLTQTFPFAANDLDSYADIQRLYFLINPSPTVSPNTCHGFYDQSLNAIYLYDDNLSVLLGPLTPGTAGTLKNGQCTINGAATTVTGFSLELKLNLNLTLTGAIPATPQNAYVWAVDRANNGTGWARIASWAKRGPNQAPVVSPPQSTFASGSPSTVRFVASDGNGADDIDRIYFMVTTTPAPQVNGCHGFYDRAANAMFLYNDALTALTPTLQNSQCAIDPSSLRVTTSPDGLTVYVTLSMSLKGAFANIQQNFWLWAVDSLNAGSGWTPFGPWLVNANRPPTFINASPSVVSGSFGSFWLGLDDPDGWTNISRVYFLVADSPVVTANSCHGFYDRTANKPLLYNDSLTVLNPPGPSSNTRCAVANPQSDPYMNWPYTGGTFFLNLELRGPYIGTAKKLYIWVVDQQGNGTGWVQAATWN